MPDPANAPTPRPQVLLVEDDERVRRAAAQALELGGFDVRAVDSAEQALAALVPDAFPGVVVTDVRLPGRDGLALLRDLRIADPELPVALITGHGDVAMAVEAMRDGAWDFIEKPFPSERLVEAARRATAQRQLVLDNRRMRAALATHEGARRLVGQSPAMQRLRGLLATIGQARVDVLVEGETGCGKEVVARTLHDHGGGAGPFVAINCAALPETVFESEIFGAEAGAFTGATKRRVGKLEHAADGTVFLDEIESMPLALQVKLLRALQERSVERLGSNQAVPLRCTVVAATKVDLKALAAKGAFREDLYYRLNVAVVRLPPLRERREDIPLLMTHFTAQAAERLGRPVPPWSAAQMVRWQSETWPGNVRELRNLAERWVLGLEQDAAMPAVASSEGARPGLDAQVEAFERGLIEEALRASGGSIAAAAEALALPRKTLHDRLKRLGLDADRYR